MSANVSHDPAGMIPAQVMLIAASPNCCAGRLTGVRPPRFSEIVAAFVAPSEQPDAIAPSDTQFEPFQWYLVKVGMFPPPWNE